MNIKLLVIGKTDNTFLEKLIDDYQKRLKFYVNYQIEIIPDVKNVKNLSQEQQKNKESELIFKKIEDSHYVVLLDENGKEYTSLQFADFLQKKMNTGIRQLTFIIGGAYGFSPEIYRRANEKCSLSKMTFSHQMVRLIFTEQLYRGFTILKNEPYHHQ